MKKYISNLLLSVIFISTAHAFTEPLSNLDNHQLDTFILGKSFFRVPWVEAPASTTARDGLGPLFSANTCLSCHEKNGRGKVFNADNKVSRSHVVRLSIPSDGSNQHPQIWAKHGFIPEPTYGAQISINGVSDVPFEAKVVIDYTPKKVQYADGKIVVLQKPSLHLEQLNYGALQKNTIVAGRIAPALVGLGLIEQITDAQILAHEDIDDDNQDGISGKANRVFSQQNNRLEIGRYTWKGGVSSVQQQVANAALNDMGLTSPMHPDENCTPAQTHCLQAPKGGGQPFDLTQQRLEAMGFYLTHLALPQSTVTQKQGQQLFTDTGCAQCHQPRYSLPSGTVIAPYSDFLLHDMGRDLSDGRQEYLANGSEWRTPPLWGLGRFSKILKKAKNFMHDGRARSVEEAILWHGGEAQKAKKAFMNLPLQAREKIIQFIHQL